MIALIVTMILLYVSIANAATFYVDKDVSCPGSGTSGSPYCSIPNAVAAVANAGDVIRIRDSATPYDVNVFISEVTTISGTAQNPIILEADVGHSPTLRKQGAGYDAAIVIRHVDYWTIRNLTFDGAGITTSRFAVLIEAETRDTVGIEVSGNTFQNWGGPNYDSDVYSGALRIGSYGTSQYRVKSPIARQNTFIGNRTSSISMAKTHDALIEENTITGGKCGASEPGVFPPYNTGILMGGIAGLDDVGAHNGQLRTTVRGNIIHDFANPAACEGGASWAVGIWADVNVDDGVATENVVYNINPGFTDDGIAIEIEALCDDWLVEKNIVYNIGRNGLRNGNPTFGGERNSFINNTVYNTHTGIFNWQGGDIVVKNNIVMNASFAQIHFDALAVADGGHSINYNLYFDGSGNIGKWGNSSILSFNSWKTACGCDGNSINDNPDFLDASGGDFNLLAGSPAIDTGENGADIGALEAEGPGVDGGVTRYVGKSGSDSNSCSVATSPSAGSRKLTINACIACMASGDNCIVGNGTYSELINDIGECNGSRTCNAPPSGSSGNYTIIKSENVHGAILRTNRLSGDSGKLIGLESFKHHIRVEGFYLDVDKLNTGMTIGAAIWGDSHQVIDIEVNRANQGFVSGGSNTLFRRLYVHGTGEGYEGGFACTGGSEPFPSFCHGIYFQLNGNSDATIEDSVFDDGNGYGIQNYGHNITVRNTYFRRQLNGGVGCFGGGSGTFYNNVIDGVSTRGIWCSGTIIHNVIRDVGNDCGGSPDSCDGGAGIETDSSSTVKNNLILNINNGADVMRGQSGSGSLVAGNVCDRSQSGCQQVSGGASFFENSNPSIFTHYRTHANSPAINAGVSVGSPYNVDPDGVVRPQEGGFDAGAFERGDVAVFASSLNFVQQPSDTVEDVIISPSITVEVLDNLGARYTLSTAVITLSLANNPGGGTLSGNLSKNAVAGLATFNDINLNNPGVGYVLATTSPGLTGENSQAFTITAMPTESKLVVGGKLGAGAVIIGR